MLFVAKSNLHASQAPPTIKAARYTGCGRCVAACGPHVFSLHPHGWVKASVLDDVSGGTGCARCLVVCPFDAVRIVRAVG